MILTIGKFALDAARRVARMTFEMEQSLRNPRPHRARWFPRGEGARGSVSIRFRVISMAPFLDPSLAFCQAVLASVEDVSCAARGVSVGDEVIVWDPNNCWFTVPMDLLTDSYGTAVEMGRAGSWDVIQECLGSAALEGTCWWMVTGLCCTETIYGQ